MIKNIFFSILFLLIFTGCEKKDNDKKTSFKSNIEIGLYKGETTLLVLIAEENGFFKDEGLDVTLKEFATGKDAFKAMVEGKVQYSTATEYVAVKNSFKTNNFKILTSISQANINGLIAKKSSNISDGFDLKGKTIGTTIGTATEFYTQIFLEQFNYKLTDVNIVNVSPKDRVKSYGEDVYDALFSWEPHTFNIMKKYPENFVYFNMPLSFNFDFILAADKKFHENNNETSKKILNALIKAEMFIASKNFDFNTSLKKYFNYDDEYIEYTKEKYTYSVNLTYPMLIHMNKQASFIKGNESKNNTFNANDLLDLKSLDSIDKKRVSIWE